MARENRKCADCRFAEPIEDAEQKQCRRAAPSNGAAVGTWPRVKLDDWCYAFEASRGSSAAQSTTARSSVTEDAKRAAAASWETVIGEINGKNKNPSAGTDF